MYGNKIKLSLISTIGGHFEQLMNLSNFFGNYEHFWITNRNKQTEYGLSGEKKYFINMAHFKRPWQYLRQMPLIYRIFQIEKPTHIISTGSGRTCLIPFLVSRLWKIEFIYIETFSYVNQLTKFGMFLNKLGLPIFTQWENNSKKNVAFIGPVLQADKKMTNMQRGENFIFVTLGSRQEQFIRLIQAVEILVNNGVIQHKVIVQAGHTKYQSDVLEIFDFCSPQRIDELIANAKYVITQESAGIGTNCLKHNIKFLVMPRNYAFNELPAKSDMKEDLHIQLEKIGYTRVVHNVVELEMAIKNIHTLKTGFQFDNKLAVSTLTVLVETGH